MKLTCWLSIVVIIFSYETRIKGVGRLLAQVHFADEGLAPKQLAGAPPPPDTLKGRRLRAGVPPSLASDCLFIGSSTNPIRCLGLYTKPKRRRVAPTAGAPVSLLSNLATFVRLPRGTRGGGLGGLNAAGAARNGRASRRVVQSLTPLPHGMAGAIMLRTSRLAAALKPSFKVP